MREITLGVVAFTVIAGAFLLGILGVAPAAFRASRISVALALKDT